MSWFDKILPGFMQSEEKKGSVPEGLWTKCTACETVLYSAELKRNQYVCPKCDHHMRVSGRERLLFLFDDHTSVEIAENLSPKDPMRFRDQKAYKDRAKAMQKSTGEKDSFVVMKGTLMSMPLVAGAFEFKFMGGSMGSVMGEKFVRGVDEAIALRAPFVVFSASGGARMQEGLFSLMQMAKTSAALGRLREARLPFVSVMTDPTMGGVSASFAMLGDVNLAEPKALIGFAGPRVIEQTVREKLPEGFQRSEFLLEHGLLDRIVHRHQLREEIYNICSMLLKMPKTPKVAHKPLASEPEVEGEILATAP